ncbi:unnamed protein product [Notodromas monacha]|uniref:Uncharacterized protein n=1 Tax=Notodromas monacha TaxID=399045 RepID=A0A7R9BNX8_9CRUS|nr:unnamed protein product [Notodromas monacha]CAG0917627.1 unnamed protein product [Notodromas monacha]
MAVRMYLWQAVLAISMWKRVLANEKRELGLNLYGGGYENYSLAHVNATGPDDVLHYLWGASRGGVSLVIVLTKLDTEVNIRWNANGTEGVMSDIKFSEDPLLSFGIIVPLVMQYRDIKDTANIGTVSDDDVTVYDMRDIQWRGTVRSNDPDSVVLRFVGTNFFQKNLTSGHPLKEDSLVFQACFWQRNDEDLGFAFPFYGFSPRLMEHSNKLAR